VSTFDSDPTANASESFRAPVIVVVLLTLTAGFADGHCLTRSDVFVANQSGNVVRIGMGLVGEYSQWPLATLSMLGFGLGAMVAWLLGRLAARRPRSLIRLRLLTVCLLVIIWCIALLAFDDDRGITSALIGAITMGVLATVITKVAGVQAQTTFQSATVLRSAQGLLAWITHADPVHHTGRLLALLGALTLTCYAAGGALGAVTAGLGPAALLIVLVPLVGALLLVHRAAHDASAAGTQA
jgi:uncharacterized membrane protein YoaK (UPF0700 family)